jgi:UDP-N-acetylglucosamine 2-epimerase (non-hydrolysing)
LEELGLEPERDALHIHEPLSYAEMLATVRVSRGLFTDSGGLQKEAYILRVPCVTIRGETEWPETLEGSWNVLAEPDQDLTQLTSRDLSPSQVEPFGDGNSAGRVVKHLLNHL